MTRTITVYQVFDGPSLEGLLKSLGTRTKYTADLRSAMVEFRISEKTDVCIRGSITSMRTLDFYEGACWELEGQHLDDYRSDVLERGNFKLTYWTTNRKGVIEIARD